MTSTASQRPQTPTPSKSRFAFPHRLIKSTSSPNIHNANTMAVAGPQPAGSPLHDHSTIIMDTRTPSPVHRLTSSVDSEENAYKPDLNAEITMLNTKLVNAINYQTNLDDSLQQSRHELEMKKQRCEQLELETARHLEMVTSGILVKKSEVDKTIAQLRSELAAERAARDAAEKGKKQTEAEVENLTGALFEEANNMVANARKETEAAEKRNAQLKSQLQDQEMLMASQQEQLQELKATIETMRSQTPPLDPSIPSTPVTAQTAVFDALRISPNAASMPDLPPEHPLHFSQLISPVLRNDVCAYTDFQDLLLLTRRLGAHSRQNSSNGSQSGAGQSTYSSPSAAQSSPNLPGAFSFSGNSSPSSVTSTANLPALKESKFYKRVLTEDIEPTLRLDLAPGLSFLSRRSVLGSLLSGTLAVEPYPQNKHYFACTMCGESRRGEQFVRKYRFRTSEDDNVSKPLCDYCLSRVRATCDFVGFLRMVRDGHWKCDSEEDQKSGWEESVKLRERMFWARMGGGVVPSLQLIPRNAPITPISVTGIKSTRPSLESIPEGQQNLCQDTDASPVRDVFQGEQTRPRSAIGEAIINASSGAAVTAVPELQPSQARSREQSFVTPPPSSHAQLDSAEPEVATDTQPTTPFEDANQQLENEMEAAASQAIPNEKIGTEKALVQSVPEVVARSTLQPPETRSTHTSPRSSLSVERPAPHERKNSSVLARVRAMEAARSTGADSSKSLPGAFD